MDKIREQFSKPLVAAGVAFIVGLLVGWMVLGWVLFPVEWTDATPEYLRQDLQEDYLRMSIDSWGKNQDVNLATQRWKNLGASGSNLLAKIQANPGMNNAGDIAGYAAAVQATPGQIQPVEGQETTPSGGPSNNLTLLLAVMCILTLAIGGALVYFLFFRGKRSFKLPSMPARRETASPAGQAAPAAASGPASESPVVQYLTTYNAGNDLYDDSFSIDSPTGEFLGECGVGISDTIGVGDPKKVSAFEVWLFDKNDIQTVTKVLMSAHAYNDPSIRQRLASKGEPVLAEPGKRILLETATLQLEARVIDMSFGQGALPQNSYFDQLTLELAVWPKSE